MMSTVYRVRVSGEVAQTATGTRRRIVETSEGPRLLEFGKSPLFLPFLPPEVEKDPHLIVTSMSEDEMKQLRGKLTPLPLPGAETSQPSPGAETQPSGGPQPPEPSVEDRIPDDQVIGAEPELVVEAPAARPAPKAKPPSRKGTRR